MPPGYKLIRNKRRYCYQTVLKEITFIFVSAVVSQERTSSIIFFFFFFFFFVTLKADYFLSRGVFFLANQKPCIIDSKEWKELYFLIESDLFMSFIFH